MQALRRALAVALAAAALGAAGLGCRAHAAGVPRSKQSFDPIQRLVTGRTEADVERLLGRPDAREARPADEDVWIWWDFTFLDGVQYAPEVRGQVVHLEITFARPQGVAGRQASHAGWRVAGPFSVSYSRRLTGS
ncbi:MAG TPA: hypothetical protein VKY89_02605 [Thermoanaerobaculia bacterium]|jgi:hypothetical protein|nr:hypothetical protein [Thermoanaerobaculia bacterium]